MQSFKSFYKEANIHSRDESLTGSVELNPAALGNPAVVRKLNAVVGAIANMEYLMPENALQRLKSSLNKIGLSFGAYPEIVDESGSMELPLTLFGGRFGKDIDTPHNEFIDDDGLSNKIEGGLSLNITYETTETNQCRLRASIK